jgi:hypothetical protein
VGAAQRAGGVQQGRQGTTRSRRTGAYFTGGRLGRALLVVLVAAAEEARDAGALHHGGAGPCSGGARDQRRQGQVQRSCLSGCARGERSALGCRIGADRLQVQCRQRSSAGHGLGVRFRVLGAVVCGQACQPLAAHRTGSGRLKLGQTSKSRCTTDDSEGGLTASPPVDAHYTAMALRELPYRTAAALSREARPVLRPIAPSGRRHGSSAAVDEVESASSLRVPPPAADAAKSFDPVARSRLRRRGNKQLPPSRWARATSRAM